MSKDSNNMLFSVRIPKSIAEKLDLASKELRKESKKTEAEFKRYVLTCGLWVIEKKLKRTDVSPDEFERLHNPRTHSEALDAINKKLENIEKKAEETKRLIESQTKKTKKSWFK
ncbi:hypothetical protein [uncultured Shewanella sp.]|uniref:hypothetical protein n=1 Tax=uncultured Shewanella sp. TaxID=173975 RepID=UPI0026113537|nr:hypothetical protein [uncultured Shewanella sp.]